MHGRPNGVSNAAPGHVHIVGAGLAGLAAALSLAQAGRAVTLYEQGPAAGGRCRSYFDRGLGLRIDNGNHLLLSGNHAAMTFLEQIGTRDTLGGPGLPHFAFHDVAENEAWTLRPSVGRIPWWLLRAGSRVPGSKLREHLSILGLRRAGETDTVAALLGGAGALYRRLLEPLSVSALNTRPDVALARLFAVVIAETLLRGGRACIPSFPRTGLSESFVDPAIAWLRARGGTLLLGRRVAALDREDGRVTAIRTLEGSVAIGPRDDVVLAAPAWVAADLLPGLVTPDAHESILNVHFRTDAAAPDRWSAAGFCGMVGGVAEWVFAKPGVVSVTVSAANHLVDKPAEEIASLVWSDVSRVYGVSEPMPPVRVVKERRATFHATAEQERRRPGTRVDGLRNLVLAGDWTSTGLPATIEGAIRSGRAAAAQLLDA